VLPGVEFTVFYDGGCPACNREIDIYRCRERGGRIDWVGLSDGAAMRLLHAIGADGTRHVGIDAFIEIWCRVPGFRPLARIASLPGVRHGAQAAYRLFALRLRPRLRRRRPLPETRSEERA
jgi:predicted DCC family thiol-disulfide oxidoreductase YuxK